MKNSPAIYGRPPEQRTHAERFLRNQIRRGLWCPGDRLPTRQDLVRDLGVSIQTLQGAIDDLRQDGMLDSRGRAGTFVADAPLLDGHIALVFPNDLAQTESRYRFWETLRTQAEHLAPADRRRVRFYYLSPSESSGGQYTQLENDLKRGRLSGVVFASLPNLHLLNSELWKDVQVPTVCLAQKAIHPQVQAIYPDQVSFIRQSLHLLHESGCRRPALLGINELQDSAQAEFDRQLAALGMHHNTLWRLYSPPQPAVSVQQVARMLASLASISPSSADAPDSLIITDDNLVTEATRGLRQAQEQTGHTMKVAAYTNFPNPPRALVPVMRVGVDVQEILSTSIQCVLDSCKSGATTQTTQTTTLIASVTESQYARQHAPQ